MLSILLSRILLFSSSQLLDEVWRRLKQIHENIARSSYLRRPSRAGIGTGRDGREVLQGENSYVQNVVVYNSGTHM